jgi:hypothetical protein
LPKTPNQTPTTQQPQFGMNMTDDALVLLSAPDGNGVAQFTDEGYMPVNSFTLGMDPLHLPSGEKFYIHYHDADGTQENGTIHYEHLQYELVGYKGKATFTHDSSTGAPIMNGGTNPVTLASGKLISGDLAFQPDGNGGTMIAGMIDVSVMMGGVQVGQLDISVKHEVATDLHGAPGGFTLDGGTLQATFIPATFV